MPSASTPVHVLHGRSPALREAASALGSMTLVPAEAVGVPPSGGVLVVELDALSESAWNAVAGSRPGGRGVVVVTGPEVRPRLAQLFERRQLRHLLACNGAVEVGALEVCLKKLSGGAVFGTEPYLRGHVERRRLELSRASQKQGVVREAGEFAAAAGVTGRHAVAFCTVADELVTNAVFNAPADAAGLARYAHLKRDVEVELAREEAVEIELASDGERLVICVTDLFGTLTVERVQDSMARCLRKGPDQVADKGGGAGLGLYYTFELLSHLVFNIARGRSTQVIGLIDTRGSFRDWAARAKSFDVYVEGEG